MKAHHAIQLQFMEQTDYLVNIFVKFIMKYTDYTQIFSGLQIHMDRVNK